MRWIIFFLVLSGAARADGVAALTTAATDSFAQMPQVIAVAEIAGNCGADNAVDPRVAYCTTSNTILMSDAARALPELTYLLGHAFGHAVQVHHGIADVALREIRNRRDEEAMLRGLVERQVDCIAGFLHARAELSVPDLRALFDSDPMHRPHWGRSPLKIGPVIEVPVTARAQWFEIGQHGEIAACAPGEFTGQLLVDALRD